MRAVLVGLIVAATAAFVIGTAVERHDERREPRAEVVPERHGASGESAETHRGESAHEGVAERRAEPRHGEQVLGVDLESTPLVIIATLVSLALAGLVAVRSDWRLGLLAVAAFMAAFAAADIREAVHQHDEHRTGLVALAAAIAVAHLVSSGLAVRLGRRTG